MSDLPPQPTIKDSWQRVRDTSQRIDELVRDELAQPEIPGKSASCRQIATVYTAFLRLADESRGNPELQVAGRLRVLKDQAMATATRYLAQGVFKKIPNVDLAFVFDRVVGEETFENLLEAERRALELAAEAEKERQLRVTRQPDGFGLSFVPPPAKMLATLLWNIRDL